MHEVALRNRPLAAPAERTKVLIMTVFRPADLIGQPLPDLALEASAGGLFALRQYAGRGSLVLFFYIHNGTPG